MPPSSCLRSFSQLSVDRSIHSFVARSLLAPHTACFSTSAARYANPSPKKGKLTAAPKRGTKTLNVKKGRKAPQGDSGKKPAQGERKAQRKRIVLTNDNALEVSSLHDLAKGTIFSGKEEGHVRGIPEEVVVALKAVEAFKTTQGWGLFRRPATLMRKQTLQLASLLKEVEESEQGQKKTIRRVLSGERLGGKSTLLLQALTMAFLREWVVINLPEAQDIVNAHTEYAPLPASQPTQYTQDIYTANLLAQTLKANERVLGRIKVATNPTLPLPLPAKATLKQLTELGAINPDVSWAVFLALWEELSLPGRPPVMLAIDGLSHIMKNSDYLSAEVKPIHAHDLTLIRHFVDHLSGQKSLPNGGVVLAATSQSNAPTSPALDHSIQVAEMLQRDPNNLPRYDEYKKVDQRVMDVLKDLRDPKATGLDVIKVGGLSKDEARSIMEYYAESGMLRARVDDSFVSEKWCLAGMGNIGELERASVRQRI